MSGDQADSGAEDQSEDYAENYAGNYAENHAENYAPLRQEGFGVCSEWGREGVLALAPTADVVVIVDVLSFSTCVDVATARGASILPYAWRDESAEAFAREHDALLAGENELGLTLRPESLLAVEAGCRLVLPSPNGSELSTATGSVPTIAGSLRNARAVAHHAAGLGERILVVPAGERWPDGHLRPSFEDQCGAGAIIRHLPPRFTRSPDAHAAVAVFDAVRDSLHANLLACASGLWKQHRGQERDVAIAAELDVSRCVPVLADGAYADVAS